MSRGLYDKTPKPQNPKIIQLKGKNKNRNNKMDKYDM